jgi:phosphohistidine phosphatase
MTSSALRTRRSWELLNGFGDPAPTTEVMDRLYLAGPSELLAALHAASDAYGTLLLIGHNPGLHDLALHLAGSEAAAPERLRQGLPTCTLVAFSVGGSWRDLGPDSIHGTQMFAP